MTDTGESRCVCFEQSSDPVLSALCAEQEAQQLYADALTELDRAGAFLGDLVTQGEIYWHLYKLEDLETAKTEAWKILAQAEKCVLDTKPTSLEGSVALLSFVRKYLSDYPKLMLVFVAIGNVKDALIELSAIGRHSSSS